MKLEIKNLHVEVEGKKVLNGINLKLEQGEIHALMGPNGSGKTTLAQVLMGDPKYEIKKGKIMFNNKDITNLKPNKRAELGIFLSFQQPIAVSGIRISKFLREAHNSVKRSKLSLMEFQEKLEKMAASLNIDLKFLERCLNEGFSGGEKKKMEILQLAILDPKLDILDETDSGLDIDALKIVAKGVNKFMNKNKTLLIITHYKRILDYIKPDKVFVLQKGKIVKEGGAELVDHLEEKGYN